MSERTIDRDDKLSSETAEPRVEAEPQAPTMLSPALASMGPGLLRRKLASRLARKSRSANGVAGDAGEAVAQASGSSGAALPAALQGNLEGSLGADLGNVRIHTGESSTQAADSVGARAYTVGNDIHFGKGEYDPSTTQGQHLIAHEVVHTVQQGGEAGAPQHKLEVSEPGDAAEVEADAIADAFVGGGVTGAAVAPLAPSIARAPAKIARVGGWASDPKVSANNKDSSTVAGAQRIPLEGLSGGLKAPDAQKDGNPTAESADQRAMAVVPGGVDFTKNVDVLLHFHGHNVGYRERTSDHGSSGPKGSVRDVETDQIEQQMSATSYKNVIAILPQGTTSSDFGAGFNADAYVSAALAKLGGTLSPNVTILRGKVILAGHSGGGPEAVHSADKLNPAAVANADDPFAQDSPLLLFDGINGTGQMATVKQMLGRWIDSDIARCTALGAPTAATKLKERGLHFRSTYSAGDYYGPVNVGGTHFKEDPAQKGKYISEWSVGAGDSVAGFIKSKLAASSSKSAPLGIDAILLEQYKVESVGGSHDRTMSTGAAKNPGKGDRDPSTGIPNYTNGTGNLEKALNGLAPSSSAAKAPATPAPTPTPTPTPTPAPVTPKASPENEPSDAGAPVGTGPDEADG